MRTYELMYILRPDLAEEDLQKLVSTIDSHAASAGATVQKTDVMGKRRLAYEVRKFADGIYVLSRLEAENGNAIHEVERRLRVTEQVIKFQTVRTDEEQKRQDKIQKLRASRVKRSTEAPAASAESAPPVGEPAAPEAQPGA